MRRVGAAVGFAVLVAALAAPPARAQAEDPDAYGDEYEPGDFGRIRFHENGVAVLRAPGEDARPSEESGQLNTPIFPGDALRTGRDQRVEVQLTDGSLVRLDRASELIFLSLPDPHAKYRDNTVLQVSSGAVQILPRIRGEEEFRVDTPGTSVYLSGDGEFRIEVEDDGTSRVISRRGVAEVSAEEASVLVRAGMSTWVEPGGRPESPRPFSTFSLDRFDRWCDARDEAYRLHERIARRDDDDYDEGYGAGPDVPYEVRPYYGELSAYGRWVSVPTYGWCWYPVGVAPGWRPYLDGYWHYGPHGYFWVSDEPWGWAPYHYGRWSWVGGYGWCWIPGRVFAGAWVAWSWGSVYLGWCPLDYWNRPAFVSTVHFGYYDPVAWTFLSVEHVVVRDVRRHAVPVRTVQTVVRNNVVVARPPRVAPRRLAEARDWRERAARLAAEDRPARMRPVDRKVTPRTRFLDTEPRLTARVPGRIADRTPDRRAPARIGTPVERPRAPVPRAPAQRLGRESGPEGKRTPAPGFARPSGSRLENRRAPEPSARDAGRERGPFPRRAPEGTGTRRQEAGRDPSGLGPDNRRSIRDGGVERRTAPRRRTDPAEGDTRERVREMYRELSRPRVAERPEAERSVPATRERGERAAPRDRSGRERAVPEARPPARPSRAEAPAPGGRRPEVRPQRPAPPPPRAVRPPEPPRRPEAARPAKPQRQDRGPQRPPKKDKD